MTANTANIRGAVPGALPPVAAAEGGLGDLLAGAEAVVDGTAGKALLAQPAVDAAAEVARAGGEVRAGLPGRLVDGEVGRGGQGRRDAAQPEAARAVGVQAVIAFLGHRSAA